MFHVFPRFKPLLSYFLLFTLFCFFFFSHIYNTLLNNRTLPGPERSTDRPPREREIPP